MRVLLLGLAAFLLSACSAEEEGPVRLSMETDKGAITLEIYEDKAPVTAANFLAYVDNGFYDGAHFYRATRPDNDPMIEVVQGGLWAPWESLDVEYAPPLPPIEHETTEATGLLHTDGAVSMARNEPGSAAAEFFITLGPHPELDFGGERNPDGQGFAVFGKVVEGMDVVRAINAAPTGEGEGFEGQLLADPVTITSVRRIK